MKSISSKRVATLVLFGCLCGTSAAALATPISGSFSLLQDSGSTNPGIAEGDLIASVRFTADSTPMSTAGVHKVLTLSIFDRTNLLPLAAPYSPGDFLVGNFQFGDGGTSQEATNSPLIARYDPLTGDFLGINGRIHDWNPGRFVSFTSYGASLSDASGMMFNFDTGYGDSVVQLSEPSGLALLGAGLIALGFGSRRRGRG